MLPLGNIFGDYDSAPSEQTLSCTVYKSTNYTQFPKLYIHIIYKRLLRNHTSVTHNLKKRNGGIIPNNPYDSHLKTLDSPYNNKPKHRRQSTKNYIHPKRTCRKLNQSLIKTTLSPPTRNNHTLVLHNLQERNGGIILNNSCVTHLWVVDLSSTSNNISTNEEKEI